jgi:hypothetical protein
VTFLVIDKQRYPDFSLLAPKLQRGPVGAGVGQSSWSGEPLM